MCCAIIIEHAWSTSLEHYVTFSINVTAEHFLISSMHVAYFAHPIFLESVTLIIFGGSSSLENLTVVGHCLNTQSSRQSEVLNKLK